MEDNFILEDRLEVIKTADKKFDLEKNAYISFSGGRDSVVLSKLIDLALPNNSIPRVFINTGIEYNFIVEFVKELASRDSRFIILKPTIPIKPMLEKYGYPFKSKEHSLYVNTYQNNPNAKTIDRYLRPSESRKDYACPMILRYQFTKDFNLKISNKCCYKLKKEPIAKWQKENHKAISILGLKQSEGGLRKTHTGCVVYDKGKNMIKFKPLNPVNDTWENWFIKTYDIKLCKLYYAPYNFKRTGCKGCPYSLDLQEQLEVMERLLPNERKQCEIIWKPVYDEYRRLNYRLKKVEQLKLF